MIEWVKLGSVILDQIFKYGPEINGIFKSKSSKEKHLQLKNLSNDIANQIQKNLLNDLRTMMDYAVNIPLSKDDLEKINNIITNVEECESEKLILKMKDIIISQFNDILMDNLLCSPKYHNLVILGTNQIYKIISKLLNDNITLKDNIERFQIFCAKKAELRAGLLFYSLNISDYLDLMNNKSSNEENLIGNDNIKENKNDMKNQIKKLSNEILVFIKNQNKDFNNDINRKISGIMICIDNKDHYGQIKELINHLKLSIEKHKFELDIYIIIVNNCINIKDENLFNNNLDGNIIKNNEDNKFIINGNIDDNNENNIINYKEENNNIEKIKYFPLTIGDEKEDLLDEEEEKNEVELFLNELVNKYINDYLKNNIENIHCTLSIQFEENYKLYCEKLEKEFNKAVLEMKNFNLKTIPLKVEFESQIKKIFKDIFMNHIFPISIDKDKNKDAKYQFSNASLNLINELFIYNLGKVKELTDKGKNEYTKRLLGEVKEKINELFSQLRLDEGKQEKVEEQNLLKNNFINNITQSLNEKIAFSSDIYDMCLTYSHISKDLFKLLLENVIQFCQNKIFQNKEFKDGIKKRIIQQIDSYQRRALNID